MLMTGGITGFSAANSSRTTKFLGEGGSQIRNLTEAAANRKAAIETARVAQQERAIA